VKQECELGRSWYQQKVEIPRSHFVKSNLCGGSFMLATRATVIETYGNSTTDELASFIDECFGETIRQNGISVHIKNLN
jgi:hypothetical protein